MKDKPMNISRRDWFAGQALAGLLASPDPQVHERTLEGIAEWSVSVADTTIRLLDAKPDPNAGDAEKTP